MVEAYLRSIGKSMTLRNGPFMCAVLAHGDIPYAGLEKTIEIGLSEHHVGKPATDAWRRVLNGSILPMSGPAPGRIVQQPSRVRIEVQRYWVSGARFLL